MLAQAEFREALLRSVRFEHCDLTEADITGLRLDGLAGAERLRGAAMPWGDIVGHAGVFAAALGIRLLDAEEPAPVRRPS